MIQKCRHCEKHVPLCTQCLIGAPFAQLLHQCGVTWRRWAWSINRYSWTQFLFFLAFAGWGPILPLGPGCLWWHRDHETVRQSSASDEPLLPWCHSGPAEAAPYIVAGGRGNETPDPARGHLFVLPWWRWRWLGCARYYISPQVCVVYWSAMKWWCRAVVESVFMDLASCQAHCLLVDHGERLVVPSDR